MNGISKSLVSISTQIQDADTAVKTQQQAFDAANASLNSLQGKLQDGEKTNEAVNITVSIPRIILYYLLIVSQAQHTDSLMGIAGFDR